jgi:hypothetical protein
MQESSEFGISQPSLYTGSFLGVISLMTTRNGSMAQIRRSQYMKPKWREIRGSLCVLLFPMSLLSKFLFQYQVDCIPEYDTEVSRIFSSLLGGLGNLCQI